MERIVIKIGSGSLVNDDQRLNQFLIGDIARQVAIVHETGTSVAIVTSGAIASGSVVLGGSNGKEIRQQVLASLGQRPLINAWGDAFDKHGLRTGLFLFSEEDLYKPRAPLMDALNLNLIPIINANDTVSVEEIRKLAVSADNDRLAYYVARFLVDASRLILLTDAQGVLDAKGCLIDSVDTVEDLARVSPFNKTAFGTGGIESKLLEARRFITDKSKLSYIAGAKIENVIVRIALGERVGTRVTLPLQGYFNI